MAVPDTVAGVEGAGMNRSMSATEVTNAPAGAALDEVGLTMPSQKVDKLGDPLVHDNPVYEELDDMQAAGGYQPKDDDGMFGERNDGRPQAMVGEHEDDRPRSGSIHAVPNDYQVCF